MHLKSSKQHNLPDEVVVCGRSSVWVPYTDPGLPLAKAIREGVQQHMQEEGLPPKLVLLPWGGLSSCGPNTLIALLPGRMNTSGNSVCILGNPLQATEIPYE